MKPNSEEHGKARAGLVTGSVADIVLRGSPRAWAGLSKRLWADDGSRFAEATDDARAYGHAHEKDGAAKFWDRHPEWEIEERAFIEYLGDEEALVGKVGMSPDRIVTLDGADVAGLEVKSPTIPNNIPYHLPSPSGPTSDCKHYAQCLHGMLVTGLPVWWLVVHHGDIYHEVEYRRSDTDMRYYIQRLHEFIAFHEGPKRTFRKKRLSDL